MASCAPLLLVQLLMSVYNLILLLLVLKLPALPLIIEFLKMSLLQPDRMGHPPPPVWAEWKCAWNPLEESRMSRII